MYGSDDCIINTIQYSHSMGVSLLLQYATFIHCQVSSPLCTGASLRLCLQVAPGTEAFSKLTISGNSQPVTKYKNPHLPKTSSNVDAEINGLHEHYVHQWLLWTQNTLPCGTPSSSTLCWSHTHLQNCSHISRLQRKRYVLSMIY